LFAWAQLAMIMTGSIAMMAYVFADYAVGGFGLDPASSAGLAALSVLALTLLNIASVNAGKRTQNLLSWLKVAGLSAIVVAGFWASSREGVAPPAAATPPASGSLGLAMILVLYTYGGWNDAAFVASEVRDRRKNLPRALLLGTLAITLVYVFVNAAFMAALGFEQARQSKAIATDVLREAVGPAGAIAISILVMLSALGATNALIFTGSRVQSSLGRDYSALARLGQQNRRTNTPIGALIAQLGVTLLLIGVVGTSFGRRGVDESLGLFGLAPVVWVGHGGFDTLLRCSAPVFWVFFLLTGLSLFVLRFRDPKLARPFRVPLYPVLPIVFCMMCAYMLYSAVSYAGGLTLVGIVPVLCGLPLYFFSRKRAATLVERGRAALDTLA
jgi:amino acid transporter